MVYISSVCQHSSPLLMFFSLEFCFLPWLLKTAILLLLIYRLTSPFPYILVIKVCVSSAYSSIIKHWHLDFKVIPQVKINSPVFWLANIAMCPKRQHFSPCRIPKCNYVNVVTMSEYLKPISVTLWKINVNAFPQCNLTKSESILNSVIPYLHIFLFSLLLCCMNLSLYSP